MQQHQAFFNEFRTEHRIIRDLILDLITAFLEENREKGLEIIGKLDTILGPHFRYEEELLYPLLRQFYGDQYVNKLLTDHDLAIARSGRIKEILLNKFDDKERRLEGLNLVRSQLPHVSDCEGVTIFVEKLSESEVMEIIETRNRAHLENLDLSTWASTIRERKPLKFNSKLLTHG